MANSVPWALSQTQVVIEVVATLAFALSGVIEGYPSGQPILTTVAAIRR